MSSQHTRRFRPVRMVALPVRIGGRLASGGFRLGYRTAQVPVRVTTRVIRVVGISSSIAFGLGVVVGLLLAPTKGAVLRAKLAGLRGGGGGTAPADLRETVTYELAHAPRTWHLPQPGVSVDHGIVVLTGEVPDEGARDELGRVAAAIPGVTSVDNRLAVPASSDA